MKITGVRSVPYEYEFTRSIGDANTPGGFRRRTDVAVFVTTDDGLEGVTVANAMAQHVIADVAEVVVGRDPRSVRGLWQRMVDAMFKVGNEGCAAFAISALDCALWDLRAKMNGVPLWRELGATERRVKAYASGLDTPLSDDELQEFYRRMADQGVTAGKLKVGLDPEADLRRLGIMHEALGGSPTRPALMVDANEYWSPKQAIRRMAVLESAFDITWCEEPARRWDHRGLRQVSDGIRAAVATGENLSAISDFVRLIERRAVDVVQVTVRTAGITGALQVADLAAAFDLPVTLTNCPGRFTAHLAAALPNHLMMEVLDVGRDAVFEHDQPIEDGWIVLSDAPGCGIRFDEDALRRHRPTGRTSVPDRTFLGRGPRATLLEGTDEPYPPGWE